MSDKNSAGIFGMVFKELARNPTEECKEVARALWPQRFQFDFEDRQMGCDGALVTLGLAKVVTYEDSQRGPNGTGIEYL